MSVHCFSLCPGPHASSMSEGIAIIAEYAETASLVLGSLHTMASEAPRMQLRDGRHLAYKESGVHKDVAKFKMIVIHGLGGSRNALFPCSQKLMEELGVYLVGFDRAGYGQSDPFPQRSIKSEAYDIEELADKLQLGSKFYIIGISIGGYSAWGCLKYIPHRLAGVGMVAPAINYWWPSLPPSLSKQAFGARSFVDRCKLRVVHYAPWLLNWWSTQKWLNPDDLSNMHELDRKVLSGSRIAEIRKEAQQQGLFESLNRDMLVQFANWEFDPGELDKPNDVPVHIWQGDKDYLVPVILQRYIHEKLPWVEYHELPGMGHLFFLLSDHGDQIMKTLLVKSSGVSHN